MAHKKLPKLPSTGEQVHVLLGGIPYAAESISCDDLPAGAEAIRLLEDVGRSDVITADTATTFFGRGSQMVARWDGERHLTTGRRVLSLVDPRRLGVMP